LSQNRINQLPEDSEENNTEAIIECSPGECECICQCTSCGGCECDCGECPICLPTDPPTPALRT
jgi:hypothetical protein